MTTIAETKAARGMMLDALAQGGMPIDEIEALLKDNDTRRALGRLARDTVGIVNAFVSIARDNPQWGRAILEREAERARNLRNVYG